jgi:HK97 gp10 family phage protein
VAKSAVVVVYDRLPIVRGLLRAGVERAVKETAFAIVTEAQRRVPVDTGTLRRSIHADFPTPVSARVGPSVEYGAYVEFGTHRTAAQPYMTPAAEAARPKLLAAVRAALD